MKFIISENQSDLLIQRIKDIVSTIEGDKVLSKIEVNVKYFPDTKRFILYPTYYVKQRMVHKDNFDFWGNLIKDKIDKYLGIKVRVSNHNLKSLK